MKTKFYLYTGVIAIVCVLSNVQKTMAQCSCSGGAQPDSVVQEIYFDSLTLISNDITFNQFDPSIGTLGCFRLSSAVTSVIKNHIYNTEGFTATYELSTSRSYRFTGPGGFSTPVIVSPTFNYGPVDLGPEDPIGTGDEVIWGPDTAFNERYSERYFSSVASYLGVGTVNLTFTNSPTNTIWQGSNNQIIESNGYTRLRVRLSYYWCPASALALKDKNKVSPPSTGSSNETTNSRLMAIYPNPTSGGNFSLQFNKAVKGDYTVDVVNIAGQKIFNKNIRLNNTNLAQVELGNTPPGLYYLRTTNLKTGVVHTNKLLVK